MTYFQEKIPYAKKQVTCIGNGKDHASIFTNGDFHPLLQVFAEGMSVCMCI